MSENTRKSRRARDHISPEAIKRGKLENRKSIKEACDLMNKVGGEIGQEAKIVNNLRDGNRRLVASQLKKTQEELQIRNEQLKEMKKEMEKNLGLTEMNKEITLTREELAEMGINLQSNIKMGSYRHLSEEAKNALDMEIANGLLSQMTRLLNILASKPDDEIRKERVEKIALSLAILADKHKIFANRVPSAKKETKVEIQHSISDLISSSSNKKLESLYGDLIDVTPGKTNEENEDIIEEITEEW